MRSTKVKIANSLRTPIAKLLPGCGNMGGFRLAGKGQDKLFVALFTTGQEKDWPDRIDLNTGQFTYYGDNRTPGELHKTPLGGNRVLRRVFDLLHGSPPQRELIPPFFVFQKYPTQKSARSVQFKGLAVPGYAVFLQPRIWSPYGKPRGVNAFRTIGRFSPSWTWR
jgi:Restriction endonuclease AspBHI N-terminal